MTQQASPAAGAQRPFFDVTPVGAVWHPSEEGDATGGALADDELFVDLFAGGGGASEGAEQAIGRHVDIAVNHDAVALARHPPRELFRAQGFPESYIIDRGADSRPMTKTAQVRMCGNSVCPPLARAIISANYRAPVRLAEAA